MKVMISLADKLCKIIDELVKEGDYRARSDFIDEAVRVHLRTWYEKRLEEVTPHDA